MSVHPRRAFLISVLASSLLAACTFVRAAWHNTPTLDAPGNFASRPVHIAPAVAPLPTAPQEAAIAVRAARRASYGSFDELLAGNGTRAFVVVRDDVVVYERYFGHVTSTTLLPSFSLSKTFAALLLGCAVDDGLIPSMQAPLTSFIPELRARPRYDEIRLDHLLRMVSGIDFDEESYDSATLYYCGDLHGPTMAYAVTQPPGEHYRYGSVNIQLLWEVLHRCLQQRTVAQYFEQRVWRPLGAAHAATWSLDSEQSGIEKLFGGLNATARDFALLGLVFLHGGTWNGVRIVPKAWIDTSVAEDPVAGVQRTTDGLVRRARYQWFLTLDGRCYFAKGYQGQYVWVDPHTRTVIVRFGEGYGDVDWLALFEQVARA